MRSFWSRVPMLRIAFALMVGIGIEIACDNIFHISAQIALLMLVLLIAAVFSMVVISNIKSLTFAYRFRACNGIALTVSIIAFGYILTWLNVQKNYHGHFGQFRSDENVLVVQIDEPLVTREKIIMAVADVSEIRNEKGRFKTRGRIQLNFLRDPLSERLDYGDVVLLDSKIDPVQGPKNPYEFNFKTYQGFHNIYHQTFVNPGAWKLVASGEGNLILASVYKLRNSFLHIIERYVKDKNDFGVASAIMLGYRDYVSQELTRAYASSGTLHVLSVSGLHVAIMFIMLNFLLQWMDKRGRSWVIVKAAFIILFIWFYACLTGLSPPVLRSALMFSFIQAGKVMARNVNTYNIIAASAIVLMLLDPFVLTDVGFQLSYLAVLGIIYLHPKISRLIILRVPDELQYKKQRNVFLKPLAFLLYDLKWLSIKLCDLIWQLIGVSLAAQIATLPLSILYFYQFPNLFLLSNLVVIPLSNLILFAGTGLFAVGHIPVLNDIAGYTFNFLLMVLDKFIFWINGLSFAQTKPICISVPEMMLMYILIFLLCWLAEERKPKVLIASLAIILSLCSFNSYRSFNWSGKKEIAVYSIPKQKAIAFISNRNALIDFDTALINNSNSLLFHVSPHWWESGVRSKMPLSARQISTGKIVLFEGQRILIVDSAYPAIDKGTKSKLRVDLVIISGNPKVSISQLRTSADFEQVVFDSSNKRKRIESWEAECGMLNIDYWDVNKQGAYIKNL